MDRYLFVTAQPGAALATIDLGQATHYLRDEPCNPPSRAATVEFRQAKGSTGGATNYGSSPRVP
jgi:hypothetical protein